MQELHIITTTCFSTIIKGNVYKLHEFQLGFRNSTQNKLKKIITMYLFHKTYF